MKQSRPRRTIFWHSSRCEDMAIDDSIRSISSEGSTIPVNAAPQKSVRFCSEHQVIPSPRRVRFAPDECNTFHSSSSSSQEEVPQADRRKLWYSERDFSRFRESVNEQCHYFRDRPWFYFLTRSYRAMRDGMPIADVGNDNDDIMSQTTPDDSLVGLEHWIVSTGRRTRRDEILMAVDYWQNKAGRGLPRICQKQIRQASLVQSRAARQWATLVAAIVAKSVQEDANM